MNHLVLEELFKDTAASDLAAGREAIHYLELLIEKHTTKRLADAAYDELFAGRHTLLPLQLTAQDLTNIKYFLFYLLMNYPDRSAATARCLVKCYDKTLVEGACRAIDAYWQQCDETTCHLTDVITHSGSFEDFGDRVLPLFRKLKEEGLPETRKSMAAKFAYYKKFYGLAE
ncbi:MAG: hypothetical protein J7623_19705 [Chitinophaga sp.]|uniref:hypothetical protein n=1 Tax=Chitinophaga sp. TaxID=1869181 RepID=UPI001B0B0E3D|nr:hypothetical protein [Chitinophaga sp.]MBO9730875.1 hypothetical protein [Chitinophaga sp.]